MDNDEKPYKGKHDHGAGINPKPASQAAKPRHAKKEDKEDKK